jgi:hypothetical protein
MLCLMIVQAANTEMSRQMAKIAELPTPRGGRPVLETRGARARGKTLRKDASRGLGEFRREDRRLGIVKNFDAKI